VNPFQTTPRVDLTAQQRAKFFYERGGTCAECKNKIRAGTKWEIDHKESLENQGSNEPENLQLLCAICHGAKTPLDRAKAAKTRSVATRGIVPEAHRTKSKLHNPKWRKKMNGEVVPR
jgi:5-methylcytosine-specific restriction endonuclease McrA